MDIATLYCFRKLCLGQLGLLLCSHFVLNKPALSKDQLSLVPSLNPRHFVSLPSELRQLLGLSAVRQVLHKWPIECYPSSNSVKYILLNDDSMPEENPPHSLLTNNEMLLKPFIK